MVILNMQRQLCGCTPSCICPGTSPDGIVEDSNLTFAGLPIEVAIKYATDSSAERIGPEQSSKSILHIFRRSGDWVARGADLRRIARYRDCQQ
jgi:hypothetical protein